MTVARACPTHRRPLLEDTLRCPAGHRPDFWLVLVVATGRIVAVATTSGAIAVGAYFADATLRALLQDEPDALRQAAPRRPRRHAAA